MGCTAPELLTRLTSRELAEWMAYDAVEGLPDRRAEILLAQLLALTANIHRDPDKSEIVQPLDFLPWLQDEDDEDEGPVDLSAKILALNAAFGGEDRRTG